MLSIETIARVLVNVQRSAAQPASSADDANAATQPASEGETTPADAEKATEPAPAQTGVQFVESGREYFDDALFIGDSRTEGIRDYGTLKNAQYFCHRGLSSY